MFKTFCQVHRGMWNRSTITMSRSPSMNGVAERQNKTLKVLVCGLAHLFFCFLISLYKALNVLQN